MTYGIDWVKKKFEAEEELKYIFFWGHTNKGNEAVGKFVFSQWFPSPFVVDGVVYKTAEHWMMAQKARLFRDETIFDEIIVADKPGLVRILDERSKILTRLCGIGRSFALLEKETCTSLVSMKC
jgi:predicted NAD-dependent protein-ADP-ribosyltransferase YbiA (DUF1768 family)